MKEKSIGGARKGAGRKPSLDPKQPVTIHVETSIIKSLGGKEGVQFLCYGAIYGEKNVVSGPVFTGSPIPDPAPSYVAKRKFPPSDRELKEKAPKTQKKLTIADVAKPVAVFEPNPSGLPNVSTPADWDVLGRIEAIKNEKIPKERDTVFGRKSWALEQKKRIEELEKQLK